MSQGFYGFPNILGLLRATNLKVLGKAGATAGAGLAGGTVSGAPTTGQFDAGDIVVDASGALFICTVTGSPGTWVQLGTLIDPTSVRGDLIVRGASSTTRLALGSTNQVLTSNGTDAVWAASPAAAGGALTQIAQTTLSSTASSITFSSIPGTYSSLWLIVQSRSNNASTSIGFSMQFNSDTASNYSSTYDNISGTATHVSASSSATSISMPYTTGSTAPSGSAAIHKIMIPNYAGTTFRKDILYENWCAELDSNTNGQDLQNGAGQWRSTAAITSIKVFPGGGSFIAGTVATLYGIS